MSGMYIRVRRPTDPPKWYERDVTYEYVDGRWFMDVLDYVELLKAAGDKVPVRCLMKSLDEAEARRLAGES